MTACRDARWVPGQALPCSAIAQDANSRGAAEPRPLIFAMHGFCSDRRVCSHGALKRQARSNQTSSVALRTRVLALLEIQSSSLLALDAAVELLRRSCRSACGVPRGEVSARPEFFGLGLLLELFSPFFKIRLRIMGKLDILSADHAESRIISVNSWQIVWHD
jgi:hypothetical protein